MPFLQITTRIQQWEGRRETTSYLSWCRLPPPPPPRTAEPPMLLCEMAMQGTICREGTCVGCCLKSTHPPLFSALPSSQLPPDQTDIPRHAYAPGKSWRAKWQKGKDLSIILAITFLLQIVLPDFFETEKVMARIPRYLFATESRCPVKTNSTWARRASRSAKRRTLSSQWPTQKT